MSRMAQEDGSSCKHEACTCYLFWDLVKLETKKIICVQTLQNCESKMCSFMYMCISIDIHGHMCPWIVIIKLSSKNVMLVFNLFSHILCCTELHQFNHLREMQGYGLRTAETRAMKDTSEWLTMIFKRYCGTFPYSVSIKRSVTICFSTEAIHRYSPTWCVFLVKIQFGVGLAKKNKCVNWIPLHIAPTPVTTAAPNAKRLQPEPKMF